MTNLLCPGADCARCLIAAVPVPDPIPQHRRRTEHRAALAGGGRRASA
ncbi:hypothetical protein [Streptomyces sp. NPDC002156]